jgi:TIR domain
MIDPVADRDFFISYTAADRPWAEWIAWELEAAGYTTLIQAWDFRPGTDWAVKMQEGTTEWSRILAVLSPHFFESKFTRAEWTSVFAKDPTGELGLLIPVRVTECEPPGLLRPRTYVDVVGLGEDAVRKKLLDGVKQGRIKPANAPLFPGWAKPKPEFPLKKIEVERQTKDETSQQTQAGPAMPRTIHNLPFRHNPAFTGRAAELKELHKKLRRRRKEAAIQVVVVHGLGGVGKTQLAVEYAWKHLGDYDAVLWVKAESPEALDGGLAALASLLRLPGAGEREQAIQIEAVLKWLYEHECWLLNVGDAETDEAIRALIGRWDSY